MTVIAYDGLTLAADKRACMGSMINTVTKIHRVGDVLVGGSGDLDFVLQVVQWVRDGRKPESFPAQQRDKDDWQNIILIEANGKPSIYNRTPHAIQYEQRCVAIGSGREYAMAAMHLGKSAREAVEVAIALDPGCGNGIDALELSASAALYAPLRLAE